MTRVLGMGSWTASLLVGVVAASVLTGCGGGSGGAEASSGPLDVSLDKACAAAKDETGRLSYVASTDEAVLAKEIAPFEKKYPQVKVQYTNLRSTDASQRLLVEKQARKDLDFDALSGNIDGFDPLFDADMVRSVKWSSLGIGDNLVLDYKGANAFRNYRLILGLGYNSDRVDEAELPSTWQELVDPKWAGKVIVDPRGQYLGGLALDYGKDKTVSWFQDFMDVDKPLIIQGATASGQKVIAGEALLTTSAADANIREAQAAGAPIAVKYLDVVPTSDYHTIILKDTPRPNMAACFLGWLGGDEGTAQKEKYEFQFNHDRPTEVPSGSNLVLSDTPARLKLQTDTATALAEIMAK
jgi:iron(III) transport system substrate-binding protein